MERDQAVYAVATQDDGRGGAGGFAAEHHEPRDLGAGIAPCVPGVPVTKPCCSSGKNNLRFIDVLTGATVGAPFGTGRTGGGEGLSSAIYVEATDEIYVYVTTCGKAPLPCEINHYSSKSTDMKTWTKGTAITT